jgi:hypothetical protein
MGMLAGAAVRSNRSAGIAEVIDEAVGPAATEGGRAPYSAISIGVAGPASGFSSIRAMNSEAPRSMAAAAPNT